ncbi:MAG: beta-ketoacyl-[acyl-carrier-protein] synthase family protein [Acidimicrobiales bacterium]
MRLAWGPSGPSDGPPGRPVAVTGIGVLAHAGIGVEAFWEGLSREPQVGNERRVDGFDPSAYFGPKDVRHVDRFTQLAVAAAEEAFDGAGRPEVDPARAGIWVGTGVGGLETLEQQVLLNADRGSRRVSPYLVPMMMANAVPGTVSIRWGWRGPCETTVTACAAGTQAIGNAARLVSSGRCVVALGGGAEAAITPTAKAGFANMTALSQSGVSRPFDRDRDGFVMGEGAAMLVLEDLEHARARGARVLALLAGAASTADAHHITAPSPGGSGAVACMELAIADAGLEPSEITHINAHGTSTPLNDAAEAEAIGKLFGVPGPPVTSVKGVNGHALGAAGALEAVASVLTLAHGRIPPTGGLRNQDPEILLDVVQGAPRDWTPGPVLSNSFGFGGHNGCLVFLPAPA